MKTKVGKREMRNESSTLTLFITQPDFMTCDRTVYFLYI